MNRVIYVLTAGFFVQSGAALAACGSQTAAADVIAALTDKAVCVSNGAGWEAQEYHQAGGSLIDYKKGPGHAVDPTEVVGSWEVGTDGRVTYHYNGSSFTNAVSISGSNICLDNGTTTTVGTIQAINIDTQNSGCQ